MTNTTEKPLAIYERYPVPTWVTLVLLSAITSYVFAWDNSDMQWLTHAGMISAIAVCMIVYCATSKRLLANQKHLLHKCLVWVVLVKALISLFALILLVAGLQPAVWLLLPDIYGGSASLMITSSVLDNSVLFFFHFFTTLIDAALHSIVVWVIAALIYVGVSRKAP